MRIIEHVWQWVYTIQRAAIGYVARETWAEDTAPFWRFSGPWHSRGSFENLLGS